MQVVLPGEADAAVDLEAGGHHPAGGVASTRSWPSTRRRTASGSPAASAPGGVVDGGAHALDVDEHVGAAVLDGLEAADRPAELHPVLGVLDGQVEHPGRRPEQLGAVTDGAEVDEALDRVGRRRGARLAWRRASTQPSAPGEVHRRLGRRREPGCVQVDREQLVRRAHDQHPGRRGVDHRLRATRHGRPVGRHRREGHRPDGLPCHQRVDQLGRTVACHQRVEGERLLQDGGGRDVAADLLEQHRQLDPAEAEAAPVLGHGRRRPALLDHGRPQPVVDAARRVDDGPDLRRGGAAVEQVAGAVAQRLT